MSEKKRNTKNKLQTMKKTVLLLFVLALTGSAQRVMAQNPGQLWWGYFTDSDAKSLSFDG